MGGREHARGDPTRTPGPAGSGGLCAQNTALPGGQLNSCVQSFYDPNEYNWYAFRDVCNQPIDITWCANNNPNDCFEHEAQPGGSTNTADSQSEVNSYGGSSLAICPAGYHPWGASGSWAAGEDFCCIQ